mmetsp:Transcript_4317/g.6207  ORF Transcript_4317/g.6207 Transcript_4317/m.6207 type:complete len:206 (+) Transcript_4317:53-670(+)
MKTVAILALAGSAAAFAPSQDGASSSTALRSFDLSKEVGAMAPLGAFDPFGLCRDNNTRDSFDYMRRIEITHGRVAMLAVTGYLTTAAGIRFPGAENIPDGFASFKALSETDDGNNVLLQMLATTAVLTILNGEKSNPDYEPLFVGDYSNGTPIKGWSKMSAETQLRKRNIEINQGRAAMMGITGLMVHEALGVSILPTGYLPGH